MPRSNRPHRERTHDWQKIQHYGLSVELEAKLAELDPYRSFVEQVRQLVRREEHDNGYH